MQSQLLKLIQQAYRFLTQKTITPTYFPHKESWEKAIRQL
jgi:hypothetical protein